MGDANSDKTALPSSRAPSEPIRVKPLGIDVTHLDCWHYLPISTIGRSHLAPARGALRCAFKHIPSSLKRPIAFPASTSSILDLLAPMSHMTDCLGREESKSTHSVLTSSPLVSTMCIIWVLLDSNCNPHCPRRWTLKTSLPGKLREK